MKNAAFDLYEMRLLIGDLHDDLKRFFQRHDAIVFLEGEGRELAHQMWGADLHMQRDALAARTTNLLGMMRAAGIIPGEKGLIDAALENVWSTSCCEAVALLKGLLDVRIAEGECYRRMRKELSVVTKRMAAEEGEQKAA
jgi:hypothetical protein